VLAKDEDPRFFLLQRAPLRLVRRSIADGAKSGSPSRASLLGVAFTRDSLLPSYRRRLHAPRSSTAPNRKPRPILSACRALPFGTRVFNTLKSEINGIILIRRPNGLSVRFSLCEPHEKRRAHPRATPAPHKSGAHASRPPLAVGRKIGGREGGGGWGRGGGGRGQTRGIARIDGDVAFFDGQ